MIRKCLDSNQGFCQDELLPIFNTFWIAFFDEIDEYASATCFTFIRRFTFI